MTNGVKITKDDLSLARAIIVLGVRLKDGRPSLQMRTRVDVAYRLLSCDPSALCIVSGARAPRDDISEAEAMWSLLVTRGIDPSRLYVEDQARNTYENIVLSHRLLSRKLTAQPSVILCTEGYHWYRACIVAWSLGLNVIATELPFITSELSLIQKVFVVSREALAIVKESFQVLVIDKFSSN